jgi:hypothetical protein
MIEWRGSSFNSMPRLEGGDGEREEGVEEEGNFLITRRVEVEEEEMDRVGERGVGWVGWMGWVGWVGLMGR